ncbi:MAG: stage 0 sporulation family protein [Candidatus Omnitrophica bacterium]|nr:stage 0 sporulation family protein [Candidatus Omnitrophota bacterium]MDD5237101.1 stage 0 sporulation family protein [Candidatus Omnitrophota bacterium]MDD5611273.1 stage 0 sporulation family protein [Candidatus Omnitrophota bacterium]
MDKIAQVRLRQFGQTAYFNIGDLAVKEGNYVIIEQDRGLDYAEVIAMPDTLSHVKIDEPLKKIIRLATSADIKQIDDNRGKAKEAITICEKKIQEHKLDMKLVEVEYSFDRSKIIFYFTAEGRIDFRELVKDLAKAFKARIELRQIGVRDEARFIGGFGPCGRQLCCAAFLRDFEPVTIKMAKEEALPLNPTKLSGLCGRLMCCLAFEHDTYSALSKGLPKEGEHVHTKEGKGTVVSVNVLKRTCTIQLEDGKQIEINYKEGK